MKAQQQRDEFRETLPRNAFKIIKIPSLYILFPNPSTSCSLYTTASYVASISRPSIFLRLRSRQLFHPPPPSLCVRALHSRCSDPKLNIQLRCSLPALFSLVLFPRASCPHEPAAALRSPFTDRRAREGGSVRKLLFMIIVWMYGVLKGCQWINRKDETVMWQSTCVVWAKFRGLDPDQRYLSISGHRERNWYSQWDGIWLFSIYFVSYSVFLSCLVSGDGIKAVVLVLLDTQDETGFSLSVMSVLCCLAVTCFHQTTANKNSMPRISFSQVSSSAHHPMT